MTDQEFNHRLKQVAFLIILILLTVVVLKELQVYLPGMLGAVTLYILSRENYFQLVYKKKWKKGLAAFVFILYYLLLLGLPVFFAVTLLAPKAESLINNQQELMEGARHVLSVIQSKIGRNFIDDKAISNAAGKLSVILPSLFTSTANLVTNLIMMLFLLYYMLYSGVTLERLLWKLTPLKSENIKLLATETRTMIRANAIGIPVIALVQGTAAALGYLVFGVKDVLLWGFLTGVFSFLPVIGSMVIWVPICIYMYASGNTGMGIGLFIYSVVVTSNVDYFARISIMKRLGDVHPVITLLGIIVGLNLFGFIGLIFGPLMVSYIFVLLDIYISEFAEKGTRVLFPEEEDNKTAGS